MNILKKFKGTYLDITIFFILLLYSFKIQHSNRISILGYCIILFGAILWVTSRYQLGNSFSVLPQATKLVKNGLYKRIRHPIYLSGIITFIGFSFVYRQIWLFIVIAVLIIIQIIRAKAEEKILIKKFGQDYILYKKSTWF